MCALVRHVTRMARRRHCAAAAVTPGGTPAERCELAGWCGAGKTCSRGPRQRGQVAGRGAAAQSLHGRATAMPASCTGTAAPSAHACAKAVAEGAAV
eukprot:336667-Chlamydomonas_euryale.AAC.7